MVPHAPPATRWKLASRAFDDRHPIPREHTADGDDRSPPLEWSEPPAGTRGFALVAHDPDAPAGDWTHWVLYDVPADCRGLGPGVPAHERVPGVGTQGVNDFGRVGWGGPSPPRGPTHHYVFRLFALDAALNLPPRRTRGELMRTLGDHVLAEATLCGTYRRP